MDDVQDNDFASNEIDMRAWGPSPTDDSTRRRPAGCEMADMSALNAPYVLPRAAGMALLARDAAHARLALERMVATGAQGRAIDMDRTAIRAGLAALDGSTQEAVAGFRAAIAGWRDLGLPWDEAMTSLDVRAARRDRISRSRGRGRGGTLDPRRSRGRRVVAILDGFVGDAGPGRRRTKRRRRRPCPTATDQVATSLD